MSIMWWYRFAQARVGVQIESAGQQLVERLVEFFARFDQMSGLEILLAGIECGLAGGDQLIDVLREPEPSSRGCVSAGESTGS